MPVMGVPPQYAALLDSVALSKGVTKSWLAAVCEQTGWQEGFLRLNATGRWRQAGLAGLWLDLPEITFNCIRGACPVGGIVNGGWDPQDNFGFGFAYACILGMPTSYAGTNFNVFLDATKSLNWAADILKDSATIVTGVCGGLSSLLWLRYIWGCRWDPQPNPGGGCSFPANTPQEVIDLVNKMASDEYEYFLIFNQPPPLVVSLQASPAQGYVNDDITFTASASGGVAPYSYRFNFGDGTTLDSTNPVVAHRYAAPGSYSASVQVTDAVGTVALSGSVPVTITYALLQATLTASPTQAEPNTNIAFTAQATGGTPPYSYSFDFGDGGMIQGTIPTATHAYAAEGTYNATVTVTDSLGAIRTSPAVVITIAVGIPGDGGDNTGLFIGLGALGLLGLLALAGVGGGDKRKRAQDLRQQAAKLRQEASQLRSQGRGKEAESLEARARTMEAQAQRLEFEAAQEESEQVRRQAGVGRR